MRSRLVMVVAGAAVLSGCASGGLSGIGGGSDYGCAAPPGVSCMSITGINANAARGTLPALKNRAENERADAGGKDGKEAAKDAEKTAVAYMGGDNMGKVSPKGMDAPYSGTPLRTPPRILRVWMAPFEDEQSDLHDQKFLYVTIHTGRWVLEANQVNIQPQFKQTFPLGKKEGAGESDDKAKPGAAVDGNGDPFAKATRN